MSDRYPFTCACEEYAVGRESAADFLAQLIEAGYDGGGTLADTIARLREEHAAAVKAEAEQQAARLAAMTPAQREAEMLHRAQMAGMFQQFLGLLAAATPTNTHDLTKPLTVRVDPVTYQRPEAPQGEPQ